MCSGGIPGFGLTNEKSAITYINAGKAVDVVILALGVNDWGASEVGALEFMGDFSINRPMKNDSL